MSLATDYPKTCRDLVRTALATIDGNTDEWTFDVATLTPRARAYVLDQITPDMAPWVFATVAAYDIKSGVSAQKEGFVEVDVYAITRTDPARFGSTSADDLNLALLTDVNKAIESAPSLANGWLDSIRLEDMDLDPENDAWGFFRLRVRYAITGTLGQ